MRAHTPGPWHLHVNANDDLEVNAKDGRTIVYWRQADDCLAPGDPDLIAAAPELLKLVEWLANDDLEVSDEARALIARVKGKS